MRFGLTGTQATQKPHVLIYAHYYHPDVASTGQLLKELAEGLLSNFHVTVICAVPSYSGTVDPEYTWKKYYRECIDGVEIIRVRVPDFNKANKKSRIKNILVYFLRAMWATYKTGHVDYIFSISQPPIFGGLLGVWGKWTKRAKYIYNIQDFNPEQTIAIGYSKNKGILKLMMALDKFSCKRADKVIVVGRDMVDTLKRRFQNGKVPAYVQINNWVDENMIYPLDGKDLCVAAFCKKFGLTEKFVYMYSGNLGLYYDLENIMRVIKSIDPGFKTPDGRDVVFAFIGAGSIGDKLLRIKEENHMANVVFIPYQDKTGLNYSLNAADVHWCINAKGLKGVSVPSKLYGCIAAGKPVLGVLAKGSEARLIIEEAECGHLCEPGDYDAIKRQIYWFAEHADSQELTEMGMKGREYMVRHLSMKESIRYYEEVITARRKLGILK